MFQIKISKYKRPLPQVRRRVQFNQSQSLTPSDKHRWALYTFTSSAWFWPSFPKQPVIRRQTSPSAAGNCSKTRRIAGNAQPLGDLFSSDAWYKIQAIQYIKHWKLIGWSICLQTHVKFTSHSLAPTLWLKETLLGNSPWACKGHREPGTVLLCLAHLN